MLTWTVRIHIRWAVILGPLAMVLFAIVFLVACIWQSRALNVTLWKTSPLPALAWGLEEDTRNKAREGVSERWMERRRKAGEDEALEEICKQMKVKLDRGSGIGALLET